MATEDLDDGRGPTISSWPRFTQLTLEQSERLLAGKKAPGAKPDDVRELLNYRDAFELVASYLGNGAPITEGLVRGIHKRLVKGVRGDAATPGEYRKIQNCVVNSRTGETVYTPPPPRDVPPMMADLVAWLNAEREANPVLVAGIAPTSPWATRSSTTG